MGSTKIGDGITGIAVFLKDGVVIMRPFIGTWSFKGQTLEGIIWMKEPTKEQREDGLIHIKRGGYEFERI